MTTLPKFVGGLRKFQEKINLIESIFSVIRKFTLRLGSKLYDADNKLKAFQLFPFLSL